MGSAMEMTADYLNYLKAILRYEPITGLFRWKITRRKHGGFVQPGDVAGTMKDGYIQIIIDGIPWRAHRLAWLLMTGELPLPGKEIDHWNKIRSCNIWTNLRLKTRSQNNHNAAPAITNRSGVRGVSWKKRDNKWDARISIDGEVIVLGQYQDFAEAVEARRIAEFELLGEYITPEVTLPLYTPRPTFHPPPSQEAKANERMRKSTTPRTTNTSGHRGVRLHKTSNRWHARIVIEYREISLGYYDTFDEAVNARQHAEKELL
jgi:hypothetical protein